MVSDAEHREGARTCYSCMYCRVCQARRQGDWLAEICGTYEHYIDRDALLALVEELETPCCGQLDPYLSNVANRIREALGVSE